MATVSSQKLLISATAVSELVDVTVGDELCFSLIVIGAFQVAPELPDTATVGISTWPDEVKLPTVHETKTLSPLGFVDTSTSRVKAMVSETQVGLDQVTPSMLVAAAILSPLGTFCDHAATNPVDVEAT
jgi:hypothetical protein